MTRYIINKGIAGLGNRLYALSNAIQYAQQTNRRLVVDWSDSVYSSTRHANAFLECFRLTDLPEAPSSIRKIPSLESLAVHPVMWAGHLHASPYKVTRYTGSRLAPAWDLEGPFRHQVASADLARDYDEDVVVFVSYKPPLKPGRLRRHVRLQAPVEKIVQDFAASHFCQHPTIGIHVRATDRRRKAGLRSLHAPIRAALADKPNAHLFLSTDNRDVIEEMHDLYGALVISRDKWLPPAGSEVGLHKLAMRELDAEQRQKSYTDAVIDLFLLSRCESLICHRGSTFSRCAGAYSHSSRTRATVEQNIAVMQLTTRLGLTCQADLLLGFPGETPETLRETIRMLDMSPPSSLRVSTLDPKPGTQVYADAALNGTLIRDETGHHEREWIQLPWLHSYAELVELETRIETQFYLHHPMQLMVRVFAILQGLWWGQARSALRLFGRRLRKRIAGRFRQPGNS